MEAIELIMYIAIFITGIVFGSFFTLAVYRIPRKENIVYVRSHCTTCDHKLGFWDLIPIFSYLFLRGKCRYCGEKIRIRYLLLEVFSGTVFLAVAITMGLQNLINLCFIYLFMAGMFIIAGIDKEKLIIPNGVCIYNLCIAVAYVGYKTFMKLSILDNIYGALIIPIIIFVLNKLIFKLNKDEKQIPVGTGDVKYLSLIGLMFGFSIQILSIVLSSLIMLIGLLIHRYKEIPWGYYLTISTIIILIVSPYIKPLLDLIMIWS